MPPEAPSSASTFRVDSLRRAIVGEAHSLRLHAVLEHLHGAFVFLNLCNTKGVPLVRFKVSAAARRQLLCSRVGFGFVYGSYAVALDSRERLSLLGCGSTAKVAQFMARGAQQPSSNVRHKMMDTIVRHVAACRASVTPEGAYFKGLRLYSNFPLSSIINDNTLRMYVTGNWVAAAAQYEHAISLGHVSARADIASMVMEGRDGIAVDHARAFQLSEQGTALGCRHCQGTLSYCYFNGYACSKDAVRALQLARSSSSSGSKWGQYMMAELLYTGEAGVVQDYGLALFHYRQAAAQGLDVALNDLGYMYDQGFSVAEDKAEALRLFKLAADQGLPAALAWVAGYYDHGWGVPCDKIEAVRWCVRVTFILWLQLGFQ